MRKELSICGMPAKQSETMYAAFGLSLPPNMPLSFVAMRVSEERIAGSKANGNRPSELVAHVTSELDAGLAVALGFECPLFVPLYEDELRLTAARFGEGARAWSAGAGCGSLATGLVQLTWVLDGVLRNMNTARRAFLSWEQFASAQKGLFLWEAFVSGSTKRETHIDDAQAAVQAFLRALPDPMKYNALRCESPGVLP